MFIKRYVVASLLLGAMLFGLAGVAAATPLTVKPDVALREAFPQVRFDKVVPTDIPGLYEVDSGANIFYYYQEKDYILTGDIIGKDLKSRTAARRSAMAAEAAKSLPLDKAVKVGDGKKVVIEFTDPDCPFCRKAFEYFSKRSDVTQYVFFAPLAHPAAITKIQYILGAENKAQAFDAMMLGQEIPAGAKPPTPEIRALAQEHLALARQVGVQGTPTFFINGEMVVGVDTKKIDELLK